MKSLPFCLFSAVGLSLSAQAQISCYFSSSMKSIIAHSRSSNGPILTNRLRLKGKHVYITFDERSQPAPKLIDRK